MNIHELIEAFAKLGDTHIGYGPRRISNNIELTREIELFWEQYPALKRDTGYVEFIEFYAGAHLFQPHTGLAVDLFGFTSASSNFNELESFPLTVDGYFAFCDVALPQKDIIDIEGTGFAFDFTEERPTGIYRALVPDLIESTNMSFYWYCHDFLEWLEILVEVSGYFPKKI